MFNPWQGQEIFLYSTESRQAAGPTQLPTQWVNGGSFPSGKVDGAGSQALTSI
jgi:hypothetical protein